MRSSRSAPARDLAMQSIKVLEFVSQRDADAVHKAGALQTSIAFIINGADLLFLDVRLSAMSVISRCCTKLDPADTVVPACVESLSNLLQQTEPKIVERGLQCFGSLADRFAKGKNDTRPLAANGLTSKLVELLQAVAVSEDGLGAPSGGANEDHTAQLVVKLLGSLCRGSAEIAKSLLNGELPAAVEAALQGTEALALGTLAFVDTYGRSPSPAFS